MILSDFTNFLLPDFNDPIQLVFFSIMVSLTVGIVAASHYCARDDKWTVKWTGGTHKGKSSDSLDIEHGSVMDLSHAVATAPEKLADVMPGLLLIIGLLGTFLGLGLALNNASNILSQPDALNPAAATNSMQNLLGMLQGLGTKFKTSTWGIIGFIILKTWSEFARFEEKRLSWVIRKVKHDLDAKQQESKLYEEAKLSKMVQTITESSNQTISAFESSFDKLIKFFHSQDEERITREQKRDDITFALLKKGVEKTSQVSECVENNFGKLQKVIVQVKEQAEIRDVELLRTVRVGFSSVENQVNSMIQELENSSKTIADFTTNTNSLINGMYTASEKMAEGADNVSAAGVGLVSAVEKFEEKFSLVLNQMRIELAQTIEEMSKLAADSLTTGSDKLHAATSSISDALGRLSYDVKETMTSVHSSIEKGLDAQNKALDIQNKTSHASLITNQSLTERIEKSNGMLEKLTDPIKAGLAAISDSNRRQTHVQTKLENALIGLQSLSSHLSEIMGSFKDLGDPIKIILQNLTFSNRNLSEISSYLNSVPKVENYHLVLNTISQSLEQLQSEFNAGKLNFQQPLIPSSLSES